MRIRNAWKASFAVVLAAALCAPAATGQQRQRRQMHRQATVQYDPAKETTVSGTVQQVKQVPRRGELSGTHVTLNTAAGPMEVALGPSHYLQQQNLRIQRGAQLEVTGVPVTLDGREILIARDVQHQGRTIALRDERGFPAWAGSAARMAPGAARRKPGDPPQRTVAENLYDPSTETTIRGSVQDVRDVSDPEAGRQATIQTPQGPVSVHLGPQEHLTARNFQVTQGDELQVTGSIVDFEGKRLMIAREIAGGGQRIVVLQVEEAPVGTAQRAAPKAYDPATETTLSGTVQSTRQQSTPAGRVVVITLSTAQGPMQVHLAPQNFIERQNMKISQGDRLEVTGSRIQRNGQEMVLAREVIKGGQTATLRNERGVPQWSAAKPAPQP